MDIFDTIRDWYGDVVVGEIHYQGFINAMARRLRTGFVVSKMFYNLNVGLLQPLGLTNTMGLVGPLPVVKGAMRVLSGPHSGEGSVWAYPSQVSGFMEQILQTFSYDIQDASRILSTSLTRRWLPENVGDMLSKAGTYHIVQMQNVANIVSWYAGYSEGQRLYGDDQAKLIEHADDVVRRSQGSGLLATRTGVERGTTAGLRQNELLKQFGVFMNFFVTKNSIAYETLAKAGRDGGFTNLGRLFDISQKLFALYLIESLVLVGLRELFDKDEYDEDETSILDRALIEGGLSFLNGIPFVREVASSARGFVGGGVLAGIVSDMGKFYQQARQGEVDAALLKSAARTFGTLARFPGVEQWIRTTRGLAEDESTFFDLLIGPPYGTKED